MPTIKDVAKTAGVSIATVSRVINQSPKTSQSSNDAVKSAMEQLGYRPNATARALVNQTTNTMGVIVGDVSDPFFGTMVKSVDAVARNFGKHTLIGNGYHKHEDEQNALELLINNRCDAIVVHSKALSNQELIQYAKEIKGMVVINRYIPQLSDRCIYLNNYKGAYLATEHLIKQGHSKIACIASNQNIQDTTERLKGYYDALKANDIQLPESYVAFGEPDNIGGELATTTLLNKSIKFTGLVAYNDYMAAGAINSLEQNNIKVPENVSIIGFDDGLIARFVSPKLTTVHYPIDIMAKHAAHSAIALVSGQAMSEHTKIFSPTIVCRDSVRTL